MAAQRPGLTQALEPLRIFLAILVRAVAATSWALTIMVFGLGLAFGLFSGMADGISLSSFINGWSIGFAVAISALFIGFIPAILVGAPLYSLLAAINRNSYVTASLIAVAASFGMDFFVLGGDFATIALTFAVPIALLTHYLFKRFQIKGAGSNNSFKPRPLRGSA